MSKKNDDFFNEKKPWSEVKDELLGCYLKPYMQKIIKTRKPIVYVDCFAGKGVFEDGKPGSPLIALQTMMECMNITLVDDCIIKPYFIDLNYSEDLKRNLCNFKDLNNNIIGGNYEEVILRILKDNEGSNVFLYIDPYGIKALKMKLFEMFASGKFNSVELLINLNSYGFIREGCRVLGVNFDDDKLLDELVEYETTKLKRNEKSVVILNEIAGGTYWQNIIQKKNKGEIDTKEAESIFAEQYCKRLKQSYKYILNMPVRLRAGHPPKYRLVHATNHVEGCLLMVNNICNRWELMKEVQACGQMSIFTGDIDNKIISNSELENMILKHIEKYREFNRLNDILADFFMVHGPICSTGEVNKVYKNMEKTRRIEVIRTPETTSTGQLSRFFADERGKMTRLRWIS